jgi:hypothetical protein
MVLGADGSVSGGIPAGGRNRIINGGFDVWQRGTSFTNPAYDSFSADRWMVRYDGTITSHTISQQAFTLGSAPVSGYEGTYFWRWAVTTNGTSTGRYIMQKIEDARTFAGQTVTLSFWAKTNSGTTSLNTYLYREYGTGGSTAEAVGAGVNSTITTNWQRFSVTYTVSGISGKTVGAGSNMSINFYCGTPTATIDLWGVQLEAGNSPTPFETKPYAQELRECQRYYELVGIAIATSSPAVAANVLAYSSFAVTKRITGGTPTRITNDYFYGASGMSTTTSSYIVRPEGIAAYRTSSGGAGQTQFSELVAVSAEL